MDDPMEPPNGVGQEGEEQQAIVVAEEDVVAIDAVVVGNARWRRKTPVEAVEPETPLNGKVSTQDRVGVVAGGEG